METRTKIVAAFIEYLREHGHHPATVYKFCKELGIEERDFFAEFSSFEAIESEFWRTVQDKVATAISAGEEWPEFTARQQYLTFLFAFGEESLNHRSLLLSRLGPLAPLSRPAFLAGFEDRFKVFMDSVIAHGITTREVADRGKLTHLYNDVFYLHFRRVIAFNLKDESRLFERTDAFIEKSVAVAFDLVRSQVIDSAFDLARFLVPKPQGWSGRAA